ncbi:hypothetical protein FRC01_006597 [Tulasnella sp. 417]|nr:hypothetical protein FRC01_006597 [Tulasnella sp. 417]
MQGSPQLETISLLEELTSLDHTPTPVTEQLAALHQALGRASINMTRNKHRVYSILWRSREICNHLLAAFESPAEPDTCEFELEAMVKTMKQSHKLIYGLEEYGYLINTYRFSADNIYRILLEIAGLMSVELETFGPATLSSWPQSRAVLIKIWNHLSGAPFDIIPDNGDVLFKDSSYFDDCAWFSCLLHEIIAPEIVLQLSEGDVTPFNVISVTEGSMALENAIKCLPLTEASRDIAIDIAITSAKTLSETTPVNHHRNETRMSGEESRDWLLNVLAE